MRSTVIAISGALASAASIPLDGTTVAHVFDGIGGLSAGASSRLLIDYPEPQRSQVLDALFLPNYALAMQILKVEIGGDTQSTDGSEASHQHSRSDLGCTRGYETWLMQQAKARNPAVRLFGLSWGVPGWIGNGSYFTPDNWAYQTAWLECQRAAGNEIDFLGVWNERYWGGPEYVAGLRATLDAAGFASTKIVIPDGGYDPAIMADAAANATFNASFDVVGLHYPCTSVHPEVAAGGKAFWASEDWWQNPDWPGAQTWGHLLVHNYVASNMTATIAWSPLWSVYPGLPDEQAGLMLADEPWSGHYDLSAPLWTGAQVTQFTAPGWRYLSVPGGGSGLLPGGGDYATLVRPDLGAFTLILETLSAGRCSQPAPPGPQSLTFAVAGGLPGPRTPLAVWRTNATSFFVRAADTAVGADGMFGVTIAPNEMVTVTTLVTAGGHGAPAVPIPPTAPFPLPYVDDFSGYAFDAQARYLADQYGSFAVRNGSLQQLSFLNPGANAWIPDGDPLTIFGGIGFADYAVSATGVTFAPLQLGDVVGDGAPAALAPCNASDPYQQWTAGAPARGYLSNAAAAQCLNVYGCKSDVVYWSCVTSGGTCCGPDCYDNLKWTLSAAGQLVTADAGGGCVTASGVVTPTFSIAPCGAPGAANQTWTRHAASGQLEFGTSGSCLAAPAPPPPPPPPVPYSQVCGRMGSFAAFSTPAITAYCLVVRATGAWALTTGDTWSGGAGQAATLANGTLPAPFDPTRTHSLQLRMAGSAISVTVDGAALETDSDSTYQAGMAAVGSGYHAAAWGGLALEAATD